MNQLPPLPDPSKPFAAQMPIVLLAQAILGEAEGSTYDAKIAVGCVVRNRVGYQGKYGNGFSGVITKPYQFSSFNPKSPRLEVMMRPENGQHNWPDCYQAAEDVMYGNMSDPTSGAVFYFTRPLLAAPAAWGEVYPTVEIDGFHFFRDKPRPGIPT